MGAKKTRAKATAAASPSASTASFVDDLLSAALDRGDDTMETGRLLVTFKQGALDAGVQSLSSAQGMRVADARDFEAQAVAFEALADADAIVLPEIGVAIVSGSAAAERGMSAAAETTFDGAIDAIEPEHFVFIEGTADVHLEMLANAQISRPGEYLRGFVRAAEVIAEDLRGAYESPVELLEQEEVLASGATWGLTACKVPASTRSGAGIRVAILDTGMDVGHPDFAGRLPVSQSFVGQPVQDLHSHGTHCLGTACGPKAPAGSTPRYGIAHRSSIFIGKVLTNAGKAIDGSVLGGMNWAIANGCHVISLSLGSQIGPVTAYTAAGRDALNAGLLMIAAAGNAASTTGAPANSPTIMSVANIAPNLTPWPTSNFGKIEISGPGVNVYSSVPRPVKYGYKTGTSMACPHVAGCAALWAETSPSLRGINLWNQLRASARRLPFPASRVGSGLVQAPA